MNIGQLNAIFSQQALCEENIYRLLDRVQPPKRLPTINDIDKNAFAGEKLVMRKDANDNLHRKTKSVYKKWTKYEEQQLIYGKRQRIPKGRTVTGCIVHLQAIGEKIPKWLYAMRYRELKHGKR